MTWLFVLLFLIGGLGIQYGNGFLAKNGVSLSTFITMLPLLIVAQYLIASGYQSGTESFSFVKAHIVWTAVLIVATLAINYYLFQSIPGTLTLFALLLAGVASVLAILGK
jgi:hypothetical protein